jgi:hypothetical protein
LVERCPNDLVCDAVGFPSPSAATTNKTCRVEVPRTLEKNSRLAGEFCFNSTQCFNNENGAKCSQEDTGTLGSCSGAVAIDEACTETRECGIQAYCSPDTNKCQAARYEGQACDDTNLCRFGLICVASDSELTSHTCHAPGSLENGHVFKPDYVEEIDEFFGIDSVCRSHNTDNGPTTGSRECRPGDKSFDENRNDLRRSSIDGKCEFTTFVGEGTTATAGKNISEAASCGFNTSPDAWCRKRKGDKWFNSSHTDFIGTNHTTFNCHPDSFAPQCYDAWHGAGHDVFLNFNSALKEVDRDDGFARFAENDKCVAESITAAFWRGRDPGSAYSTTLALIFASSSFLSFMF